MKRAGYLFLAFCFFCGCQKRIAKEIYSSPIIWEGEVTLERDTVIEEGNTLIIKPGSRIYFIDYQNPQEIHPAFSGVELIIKGKIIARGSREQPIIFTAAKNSPAKMGSWGAVNLTNGSGIFSYCRFEFAESGIHCRFGSLKVSHCSFFYNQIGLRFSDTDPQIADSLFFNNYTAIQYHNASPQIINCEITGNQVGIFCRYGSKNSRIAYNNIFKNEEYNIKLGEEQMSDILAPYNYWGEAEPASKIYDRHSASYIGRVLCEPIIREKFLLSGDLF